MAEQKKIEVETIYTGDLNDLDEDNNIGFELKIQSSTDFPQIISGEIPVNNKVSNNNIIKQGELCLIMKKGNGSEYIDAEINKKGELIIHGPNADCYSLDENGNLIYTEK